LGNIVCDIKERIEEVKDFPIFCIYCKDGYIAIYRYGEYIASPCFDEEPDTDKFFLWEREIIYQMQDYLEELVDNDIIFIYDEKTYDRETQQEWF